MAAASAGVAVVLVDVLLPLFAEVVPLSAASFHSLSRFFYRARVLWFLCLLKFLLYLVFLLTFFVGK